MSTINFYLDRPNNKKDFPIMLTYQASGKRFRYYTKLKIIKKAWDTKSQRIKKTDNSAEEINAILDNLVGSLKQIERKAIFERKPISITYVKEEFEKVLGKKKEVTDFHSLYSQYLNLSASTKTAGTLKGLNSKYNKLLMFQEDKNYPISFEIIDKFFYDLYLEYLINDCKLLNNTVGSCIKALKSFLNYATELGINKNMSFKKFKVFQEDVDSVYLTGNELMHLNQLKIPIRRLQNVKDIFCFACFTGLRFSDVSKIEQINIQNDLLKVRTIKTKDPICIPLNDYALEIIERNQREIGKPLPTIYSLDKTNKYLKEVAQIAKFYEPVLITKYSGGKRIEIKQPKCSLLSTHAARRTFITLSLEKGMRPEIVMQIVGIKKWETFKKYIKITDKVKVLEMKSKWNLPQLYSA